MLVAVVNGPSLNLLGQREPDIYGTTTLEQIESDLRTRASQLGCEISWHQSNHEGQLVDLIQQLNDRADAAIVNAAAYSHTSLAIRDALLAVGLPFVEVHLSNIFAREEIRRRSLLSDAALAVISGLGPAGYRAALDFLVERGAGA